MMLSAVSFIISILTLGFGAFAFMVCIEIRYYNEHREMRPKASSSVVEYPILIAYPSMYGMLKVCSVNDLHFRISSARVKSSL